MFSLYISSNPDTSASHIKFGGWDSIGMQQGEDLIMIPTVNKESWELKAQSMLFAGTNIDVVNT